MNCRRLEWLAADWAAGRLSTRQAAWVERHRGRCDACARLLDAETRIHGAWSEKNKRNVKTADPWSRISPRLEPRRLRVSTVPRLIWSGAAAVLLIAATARPRLWPPRAERPPSVAAVKTPGAAVPSEAPMEALASWSGMNDASAPNPAVDDPAGTAMEEIWTHIKSENK